MDPSDPQRLNQQSKRVDHYGYKSNMGAKITQVRKMKEMAPPRLLNTISVSNRETKRFFVQVFLSKVAYRLRVDPVAAKKQHHFALYNPWRCHQRVSNRNLKAAGLHLDWEWTQWKLKSNTVLHFVTLGTATKESQTEILRRPGYVLIESGPSGSQQASPFCTLQPLALPSKSPKQKASDDKVVFGLKVYLVAAKKQHCFMLCNHRHCHWRILNRDNLPVISKNRLSPAVSEANSIHLQNQMGVKGQRAKGKGKWSKL